MALCKQLEFITSSCGWGSFACILLVLFRSLRNNNTHLTLYWSWLGILRFPNLMHKLLIKPKMSKTTARPWRSSPGDLGKTKRSLFMNSERKTKSNLLKKKKRSLCLWKITLLFEWMLNLTGCKFQMCCVNKTFRYKNLIICQSTWDTKHHFYLLVCNWCSTPNNSLHRRSPH